MKDKKIIIYTDGSSLGNPGPGGWGAIIAYVENDKVLELGGYDKETTNNKMELMAVIQALESLDEFDSEVVLYTDSAYVVNGITVWIKSWQKNNWRKSDKKPVLNKELWERLEEISQKFKIKWNRIAGHSDIPGNERADAIATGFAAKEKPDLYNGNFSEYKISL